METKHTPGPWTKQGEGTVLHPVTKTPVTTFRIETSLGMIEILDETNEPEENLNLIKTSPKLLKALIAHVRWESEGPIVGKSIPEQAAHYMAMILESMQAIAEATGAQCLLPAKDYTCGYTPEHKSNSEETTTPKGSHENH